ncbi:alanine racemase [Actinomadura sp. DC4]|uniref:alanine racemase n=1 Tax=Actinomadura sp. DC4 TaxID=3055069 RepID=UPI0025B064F9|nr:alanine racemase [Actinomadura sp. DC4]MDN3354470.1 hypothetical protein [Actinomadura sp. DC4]
MRKSLAVRAPDGPEPAPGSSLADHFGSKVFGLPYETPFLGLDLTTVTEAYEHLRLALPRGTEIKFAMKCNADGRLLQKVKDLGGGFVVASYGELAVLRDLEIAASAADAAEVLFSNPVKRPDDVSHAFAAGLDRFAFDSEREAEKLAELAPGSRVYVRLKTRAAQSAVPSEGKFGVPADHAARLMLYAASLGLVPYGITFHVGSQMTEATAWETAIAEAAAVMRALADNEVRIQMLNMGGGFPVQYDGTAVPSMAAIGKSIGRAIGQLPYPVRTVVEPGRFLAAPAGVMVASVIGVAERDGARWVHLDAGAFNGFMESLETSNTLRYPVTDSRGQGSTRTTHLTGPSCDSQDTIMFGVELSHDLDVGDTVAIWQTGAYTLVYAAEAFNGISAPSAYLLDRAV